MRSGSLRYIGLDDEPAAMAERRLAVARELLGLAGYPEEVSVGQGNGQRRYV